MTTYESRLDNYVTQFTLRKNRGKDGLTGKQRRRLLHKDNSQFALAELFDEYAEAVSRRG